IVQNDIKRVVAYSTLSQLGYMTVALGVSAYSAAIFHLMTHAFFKALLFLGAGSVIIAMHHEQDMRFMGGLRKRMPITYWTGLIGTLALVGTPFFSGFYSKDAIIEAVADSHRAGSGYAYACVLIGVFVTALYSFRLLYLTFHGKPRYVVDAHHHDAHEADGHHDEAHADDAHAHDAEEAAHPHVPGHLEHEPHETPLVVTVPLILLAIPSALIGFFTIGPMLFGGFFDGAIYVAERNDVLAEIGREYHGPVAFALHGFTSPPFWLALGGFLTATLFWWFKPSLADTAAKVLAPIRKVLERKYGFDELYQALFAGGAVLLGRGLWRGGDVAVIDEGVVNGSATLVDRLSGIVRRMQTGFLYHYAFLMIVGLIALLGVFVLTR
ncbi:MAG TPA: proton-conducting transporter membrane subunit, partial [Xanthomonadales bacterium]|nr:proton-conducting transporter membrane subunit [Xanthomonadales bacterium]